MSLKGDKRNTATNSSDSGNGNNICKYIYYENLLCSFALMYVCTHRDGIR